MSDDTTVAAGRRLPTTYEGACHCGSVAFKVTVPDCAAYRAEIATLRGLLAEARGAVDFMRIRADFRDEADRAGVYADLLTRIDAALSPTTKEPA